MALQLSQASSYNSGNDLWIIANEKNTKWFNRLDWYLNFNLATCELHKPKNISPWLQKVVKQCELDFDDTLQNSNDMPILISTENWIPARWVAVHFFDIEKSDQWVASIYKTWSQLNKPTFRIFLPIGLTTIQFTSAWGKLDSFSDYTLVTD